MPHQQQQKPSERLRALLAREAVVAHDLGEIRKQVRQACRKGREDLGAELTMVAEAVGVNPSDLSRFERDLMPFRRSIPEKVANVLEVLETPRSGGAS